MLRTATANRSRFQRLGVSMTLDIDDSQYLG